MHPVPAKKIEDTEAYIQITIENMKKGEELVCAVLEKDTKEYLGMAGLHEASTEIPELGIWIKKSAHGHGYGREAVTALKQWADANVSYIHLIYPVAAANISSRKIPESLGGKIMREYENTSMGGQTWPYIDYWICKDN